MLQTGEMNRAQRRNTNAPKSNSRKAGLTFITVAGVVSGAVGLASPAHAAVYSPANCAELANDLTELTTNGGTLTANFTDTCDFAEGYVFQLPTTIIGPTDGSLNLRFTGSSWAGFFSNSDLSVSNLNFIKSADSSVNSFIVSGGNQSLTVSNSTFSDSSFGAAIYAEGNLTVSDSTFENLTSFWGGAAIYAPTSALTEVTNSTFTSNATLGRSAGGAILSAGALTVANSTFDSNESGIAGGAIYSVGADAHLIYNSTFVGNSADTAAAIFFSEGGIIANSTFWNNGDDDTYSIGVDASNVYFFGNILANDDPNVVKLIDPTSTTNDLGANLYTDTNFDDTTSGEGSSILVTAEELKLSALALNQTLPTNTGTTKTVAVAEDSIAVDYYTADSPGAQEGITRNNLAETDQRGAFRPFGDGYDVGAFELGASQIQEPEVTERETLANTGIDAQANYLGLVGLGIAAILGGSAGVLRRRKKA